MCGSRLRACGRPRPSPSAPPSRKREKDPTAGYAACRLLEPARARILVGLGHIKYLQHAALTANVVNLFDKGLQYSNFPANNGYDAAQADLLGRTVRVGLNVDW